MHLVVVNHRLATNEPARTRSASEGAIERGMAGTNQPDSRVKDGGPQLSPRMLSCLEWASHGKSSVDIGQLLGISPRTVDDYLTECRRRLGVRTRVQAIVRALSLGLIQEQRS
jgi:DNA-binding CsgD family transcriptional regulator